MIDLNVTDKALTRLKTILKANKDKYFRVYIVGGGCSGFSYCFDLAEHKQDDDYLLKFKEVKLLVDALSMQYLKGSTLDFEESLQGMRFIVSNPNAKNLCSCGNSFYV